MKKNKFILLFSAISLFLPSCKKEYDSNKLNINRSEFVTGPILLETPKQVTDIANYEDMVILITMVGCNYCNKLYPLLNEVIKDNNMLLYQVDIQTYAQLDKNKFLIDKVKQTPSMVFIKDQKITDLQVITFDSKEKISVFLNSKINLLNYYNLNTYINKIGSAIISNDDSTSKTITYSYHLLPIDEESDTLAFNYEYLEKKINDTINANSQISVYYTWRRCNYCRQLRNKYLDNYLLENPSKKIYYYETDGYMQLRRSSDETIKHDATLAWKQFNLKFKFDYYPIYSQSISDYISGTPCLINYPSGVNAFYSSATGEKVNEDNTLSFEMSYYKEIDALKTNSTDYFKAKEELNSTLYDKSLEIELTKVDQFLKKYN